MQIPEIWKQTDTNIFNRVPNSGQTTQRAVAAGALQTQVLLYVLSGAGPKNKIIIKKPQTQKTPKTKQPEITFSNLI